MARVSLPLIPSVPDYRVGCVLAGVVYLLDIRWNARDGAWYMTTRDDQGALLQAGVRVVLGAMLGSRATSSLLPQGIFVAEDSTGLGVDAGLDDLGARVKLFFTPFTDL